MLKSPWVFVVMASLLVGCTGEIADDPSRASGERPLCTAAGTTRPLLSAPDFAPMNLVSNGETVYAGGLIGPEHRVELWSAPLASNVSTGIDAAGYANGEMAIGPHGSLVYLSGEVSRDANSLSVRTTGVVLRDDGGRRAPIVEGGTETLANELAADRDGVSWVTAAPVPGESATLWRWDAATAEKRVLGQTNLTRHLGDGTEIFHTEWKEGIGTIVATPIAGGAARVVGTVGPGKGAPGLIAVDAEAIYAAQSSGPSDADATLVVMSKASGEVLRVIRGISVPANAAADDTHIYWAAQANPPRRLLRLEKATGATEELRRDDTLGPAVAVDACNVYYAAGTTVFARGK